MRPVATIAALAAVLGFWLASPAVGQEANAPLDGEQAAPQKERVASVTGEKVEIRIQSGVMISGIVRTHRVEVQSGSRYLPGSDQKEKGAGIRVFYALGLNGFIFVPYHTVDEISFKGELTAEEGARIAEQLEAEQERAERDRVRMIAELEAKKAEAARLAAEAEAGEAGEAEKPVGQTPSASADPLASINDPGQLVQVRALLKQFPPEDWKPARADEIKRRTIILDIKPSKEESEFLENFNLWIDGYRLWERSQKSSSAPDAEAPKAPSAEDDGGKSTKPDAATRGRSG